MRQIIIILTASIFSIQLNAQNNVLKDYVQQGLESNLAIKQNQLALESAQYALKVAKGMFLPTVSTKSRYTLAKGGRTIDFPIGDLVNPVYSTLNDMLGTSQFPMVENEQIMFLREKEYEAKISVIQPVFYPSIAINKRIEEQKLFMSQVELEQYKRELTYQIQEAYYNYMKALQYYDLIQKTKEVVNENHRVSEKLMENDMITRDAVLRTKSEISKIELYETDANKNTEMAKSYFNFLLNRDLDEEIIIASQDEMFMDTQINQLTDNALSQRQELQLLDHQIKIMGNVADLSKAEMLPKVVLAIDYGIQGEDLTINSDADFVMGSVVLTWDLFSGNINRNKRKQAIIEKQRVEYIKEEVSNKIKLEVKQDTYEVDQKNKGL